MSNLVNVILAILVVAQLEGIECSPLLAEKEIGNVSRNVRVFKPDKKEWVHFHHSWGLPHFPSLTSVSNFFQDEGDKEKIATKKRLEALENNQKEILAILQKLSNEITAKKIQTESQELNEKPQTTTTSQPSTEKEVTTKKIEMEFIPSTVSTSVPSTVSSSVSSTTSSTPVTRAPVTETSTVQATTQKPQSSPSSKDSQPQIPDQNENANSNSNSNTGDNQATADSAGQQSSPAPDTNSGSIVAFSRDVNVRGAETTASTA